MLAEHTEQGAIIFAKRTQKQSGFVGTNSAICPLLVYVEWLSFATANAISSRRKLDTFLFRKSPNESHTMKHHLEKLSLLAAQTASSAGRGLMTAQSKAHDLGQAVVQNVGKDALTAASTTAALARATGKSMQESLTKVLEHETTQALVDNVKEKSQQLADSASNSAKAVGTHVIDGVKKLDDKLAENHAEIKEKTETVSMGLGIAAGVAAGAALVGPPLIVAAAPIIGAAATVTGAVAGSAFFYSKWKTSKEQADAHNLDQPNSSQTDKEKTQNK